MKETSRRNQLDLGSEGLPFDDYFDAASCSEVMHVYDTDHLLQEIRRTSKMVCKWA
jgi:hypothetical protein